MMQERWYCVFWHTNKSELFTPGFSLTRLYSTNSYNSYLGCISDNCGIIKDSSLSMKRWPK